jgi:hypothetical protein
MTKNHKKIVVSVIVTLIVGGALFYACQKENTNNWKEESTKIQKFGEDTIIHGIDINKLSKEACIKNLDQGIIAFNEDMSAFTNDEIARLYELNQLMQDALMYQDMESFESYYDEFMRIYYKGEDPKKGKEKFNSFQRVSVLSMSQICERYPRFTELSENQKEDVLYAALKQHKALCPDYCGEARYDSERLAAVQLTVSIYVCGLSLSTLVGGIICYGVAAALYAHSMYAASVSYDKCIANCK